MTDFGTGKYAVSVTLDSLQDGERTVIQTSGEAIAQGRRLYIRFEETLTDPQGHPQSVRTTVKLTSDELKLIRHGAVESEQSFAEGRQLPGFYRSPYTQFNLSTNARKLEISRQGRSVSVAWEYDLYIYEDLSGQFAISLHIQEEP